MIIEDCKLWCKIERIKATWFHYIKKTLTSKLQAVFLVFNKYRITWWKTLLIVVRVVGGWLFNVWGLLWPNCKTSLTTLTNNYFIYATYIMKQSSLNYHTCMLASTILILEQEHFRYWWVCYLEPTCSVCKNLKLIFSYLFRYNNEITHI